MVQFYPTSSALQRHLLTVDKTTLALTEAKVKSLVCATNNRLPSVGKQLRFAGLAPVLSCWIPTSSAFSMNGAVQTKPIATPQAAQSRTDQDLPPLVYTVQPQAAITGNSSPICAQSPGASRSSAKGNITAQLTLRCPLPNRAHSPMLQFISPTIDAKLADEAVEIERFRARHRRLLRNQAQQFTPSSKVEDLDVNDGRKRKIPANWRQKQQPQILTQQDDGHWPVSAGTEMLMGFNAFDFSASPEAFYDEQEQSVSLCHARSEQHKQQRMAEVAKQVTSMGFHCASMWEQSLPGLRQPGGPIRQLPAFGQSAPSRSLWMPPVHYTAQVNQCRPPHHQSQH